MAKSKANNRTAKRISGVKPKPYPVKRRPTLSESDHHDDPVDSKVSFLYPSEKVHLTSRRAPSSPDRATVEHKASLLLPNSADPRDKWGFPTYAEYQLIESRYLNSLSATKLSKALISQEMFDCIWDVLHHPAACTVRTPQFRFWVRKMFKLSSPLELDLPSAGSDNLDLVVTHEGRPVAVQEQLYEMFVFCHARAAHGGRDKTCRVIKKYYSWVPKELTQQFVKACHICISRRDGYAAHGPELELAFKQYSCYAPMEGPAGQYSMPRSPPLSPLFSPLPSIEPPAYFGEGPNAPVFGSNRPNWGVSPSSKQLDGGALPRDQPIRPIDLNTDLVGEDAASVLHSHSSDGPVMALDHHAAHALVFGSKESNHSISITSGPSAGLEHEDSLRSPDQPISLHIDLGEDNSCPDIGPIPLCKSPSHILDASIPQVDRRAAHLYSSDAEAKADPRMWVETLLSTDSPSSVFKAHALSAGQVNPNATDMPDAGLGGSSQSNDLPAWDDDELILPPSLRALSVFSSKRPPFQLDPALLDTAGHDSNERNTQQPWMTYAPSLPSFDRLIVDASAASPLERAAIPKAKFTRRAAPPPLSFAPFTGYRSANFDSPTTPAHADSYLYHGPPDSAASADSSFSAALATPVHEHHSDGSVMELAAVTEGLLMLGEIGALHARDTAQAHVKDFQPMWSRMAENTRRA